MCTNILKEGIYRLGPGSRLFSLVLGNRRRGNGLELKHTKFRLHVRKDSVVVRVTENWNRFTREDVKSPSLEISKHSWMLYLDDENIRKTEAFMGRCFYIICSFESWFRPCMFSCMHSFTMPILKYNIHLISP